MNKVLNLSTVDKPNSRKLYYKRIVWIGSRDDSPSLTDPSYAESCQNLRQEISSVGLYPVLLCWQPSTGERKYTEVNVKR